MQSAAHQRESDVALSLAYVLAILICADVWAILYQMDRMPIFALTLIWFALWIIAVRLSRRRKILLGLNAVLFALNAYVVWDQVRSCPPHRGWCFT